jgi:hypothetical protein
LPPHERINLPSNSDDLVSIYGSNPQGPPVEELEEVFYLEVSAAFSNVWVPAASCLSLNCVQEFDPIKYILANISEEGSDSTYFDKQVSETVIIAWLSLGCMMCKKLFRPCF